MEVEPVTIELEIGFKDKRGTVHRKVTFGRRINGKVLFQIGDDPQGNLQTQYDYLLLRAAITEFGTLPMPVTLQTLLELDTIDRDDLNEGYEKFSTVFLGERKAEFLSDKAVRLAIGIDPTGNGLLYRDIEFGTRTTGMDEVAADKLGYRAGTIKRRCFLAGRQVVKLKQAPEDGESEIDGPMPFEFFEMMDAADVATVRVASEVWRQSFRRPGARVQENGNGKVAAAGGAVDGVERGGDSQPAN